MDTKLAVKLLSFLKSEEQILSIMEKSGYDSDVCQAGINVLEKR